MSGRDLDALFRDAVTAIDSGDVGTLQRLLAEDQRLVRDRLAKPGTWLRDKVGGGPSRDSSRSPTCSGSWRKTRCGTASCPETSPR